jgi:hypothetical protein
MKRASRKRRFGEETAAFYKAAERLRDIRTTRDSIERNARTDSGELVESLFCTLYGGMQKTRTHTETRPFQLANRPAKQGLFTFMGVGGRLGAGWGQTQTPRTQNAKR